MILITFIGSFLCGIVKHMFTPIRSKQQQIRDQLAGFTIFWFSITLFIVLILIHKNSFSQEPVKPGISLKDAINMAFQNSRDLKIIDSELQLGQLDRQEQIATLKPQVKAYGKYHWYWAEQPEYIFPEDAGDVLSNGTSEGPYPLQIGLPNNLAMGVNVEQRIFDQRFFLSKQSNELFGSLAENRVKVGKDEIAYEIARQFFELNELQSRQKLLVFTKHRISQAIKILEIQVRNEMIADTELEKTKLRLQKAEAGELRLQNGIRQKSVYIRSLMGLNAEDTQEFQASSTDTIPLIMIQGIDSILKPASFDLLEDMKESNLIKLEYMKAGHLPSLDFFADMRWVSQSEDFSFFQSEALNNQSFLGLKLDIPIYSGDLFRKQKQKAGIQNDIYKMQQDKIIEGQQLQVSRYKQELESLHVEWEIQQRLEDIALRQLKIAESKLDKGVMNINDFFVAEEEWINAGQEKNQLLLKLKMAEIDLLKASGQLEILYK